MQALFPITIESILNIFVAYFCYYCYSCYFCYEVKFLLFFLMFCYQMKCLSILSIYLQLFFSYLYYSCHTSSLKYKGTIWTTLYIHFHQVLLGNSGYFRLIYIWPPTDENFFHLLHSKSKKLYIQNQNCYFRNSVKKCPYEYLWFECHIATIIYFTVL